MVKKTKAKKAAAATKGAAKKAHARKAAPKRMAARTAKKAGPPRASAVRAPARKAKKAKAAAKRRSPAPVPKKKAARAKRPAAAGVHRRDGTGHIDPRYAEELLGKSGRTEKDPRSFIERPRSKDDLVEELGEEFVEEATSAEHEGEDLQDQEVPEDRGGPFVETSGQEEFGYGTDASNPKGAKREPFPTT